MPYFAGLYKIFKDASYFVLIIVRDNFMASSRKKTIARQIALSV